MENTDSGSGLGENGSESKPNCIVLQSFPQYNQSTEPGLFLQHDQISSLTSTHIPVQIQQSSQELNTNSDNSSHFFFGDERNLTTQSRKYGVSQSVFAASNLEHVNFLAEKQCSKEATGHGQYAEFSVTRRGCSHKIDTCSNVNTDVQRSLCLSKDNLNNSNTDPEQFEHTSILSLDDFNNTILPGYKQVTQVPHTVAEYLVPESASEKFVIDKPLTGKSVCQVGKDIGNDSEKCNTFTLHTDELDTSVVDIAEETIVTTKTEHCCEDKEAGFVSSYICGSCKSEFSTICKLHDHFKNRHLTGIYIFYQSTRTGFPRLEHSCKFTQTDISDLIESDQAQFKDDEVNDTDEYDLESGFDVLEKNLKLDGTESNDKSIAENVGTVKTKAGKDKRKRKKTKHKRRAKEDAISVVPGIGGTTRLRFCINQGKNTKSIKNSKTKNRKDKKPDRYKRISEGVKNSKMVNQSTEADEEADFNSDSLFQNTGNQSDQSEFIDADNGVVALKGEDVTNNRISTYEKFTSLNDSVIQRVVKQKEKILPSQLKRKENRISKMKIPHVKENKNENSGSYSCGICATKYVSKVKLRYHVSKVHQKENTEGQKECRWCGKSFPGSKSYTAHQRQCERNENLLCLICDKKFNSRNEVADHLVTHRNESDLKCRLCERIFTCVVTLQNHLRRHNQRKDLQCEHCGKSFYYHNLLKKHKLYCNREPSIGCPHCPLKFKTPDSLKHHMSVHSSERPYVCHVCGYAAKKSMYMKRHLRCHTGERPYVCAECGMSFAAANGLNRHRKTHTNDKPCICQYCGKSFTNNWNLKTHLRQHTGDTPYQCGQCGKAFKQNVLLKLHTKSHHPVATISFQ